MGVKVLAPKVATDGRFGKSVLVFSGLTTFHPSPSLLQKPTRTTDRKRSTKMAAPSEDERQRMDNSVDTTPFLRVTKENVST